MFVLPLETASKPVLAENQEHASEGVAADSNKDEVDGADLEEWFREIRGMMTDDEREPPDEEVLPHSREEAPGSHVDDDRVQAECESEVAGMKWQEIVFTELLDTKTPKSVCQAVGRIHAQLVELGLPLLRIHADSGKEFTEPPLRDHYAGERGIRLTHAPPTEHDSNGRVENVVKRLKKPGEGQHPAGRW